jgi:hypothetical protein
VVGSSLSWLEDALLELVGEWPTGHPLHHQAGRR